MLCLDCILPLSEHTASTLWRIKQDAEMELMLHVRVVIGKGYVSSGRQGQRGRCLLLFFLLLAE